MQDTPTDQVERAVAAAAEAAAPWHGAGRRARARALDTVADHLDAAADELVPIARRETRLPLPRLRSELARTTFQLRLFARELEEGRYLDARIDHADPDWPMGPRPDLRRTHVPLGPVVVFAASNFPFAFSVAGGDTASALAAGCPVVAKAHPGHPELSEATARTVRAALAAADAPEGVFHLVHGRTAGIEVLKHPRIRAGAFTGSIAGGRALFDIAAARPEPVPFYGELGSVNPVFVTRAADADRGERVADGLVGSFTLGAGQYCTKPGVVLAPAGSRLLAALRDHRLAEPAPMLDDRIAEGFRQSLRHLRDHPEVEIVAEGAGTTRDAPAPVVLTTSTAALVKGPRTLLAECFGPAVLVVEYDHESELVETAAALEGQLTATLVAEENDAVVPALLTALTDRAGRLLWNQWPTGVTVSHAQQHGGPYPATTAPGTTSVGTAALGRFLRPVAYQGFPQSLLPGELRDEPDLRPTTPTGLPEGER